MVEDEELVGLSLVATAVNGDAQDLAKQRSEPSELLQRYMIGWLVDGEMWAVKLGGDSFSAGHLGKYHK
jgi:hypothetical protein